MRKIKSAAKGQPQPSCDTKVLALLQRRSQPMTCDAIARFLG